MYSRLTRHADKLTDARFGITLRNSIMLISHYEHLVDVEGMEWGYETAMRGASERLAPILMTALVTALGLLPLAISKSLGPGIQALP